jgi:hypothetical protein
MGTPFIEPERSRTTTVALRGQPATGASAAHVEAFGAGEADSAGAGAAEGEGDGSDVTTGGGALGGGGATAVHPPTARRTSPKAADARALTSS